ncbi:MAG: septum formation protein Maf [Cellvibrionales bacterium]|nr:septum formation protein Maf [Cellvibrionales bacterium]MBT5922327.1 septum formation protein Maf [Cellvibrionales bacterium]MBT6579928.1 septum formation protein Maf [Cellvibrionales bacterium]
MRIVLGSGSRYRAALLHRIVPHFEIDSPDIDETALADESPTSLALRLATEKAAKVGKRWDNSLIIGSDQVALLRPKDGSSEKVLGKPGNFKKAQQQLQICSGQSVIYRTACCLLNSATNHSQIFHDDYILHFKSLDDQQITDYLNKEQPFDCAGAIKSEGLGVSLIERYEGDDPSTLIGLPLIKLINALNKENYLVLKNQ